MDTTNKIESIDVETVEGFYEDIKCTNCYEQDSYLYIVGENDAVIRMFGTLHVIEVTFNYVQKTEIKEVH